MTTKKWLLMITLCFSGMTQAAVEKYTVSLKPAMSGEKLVVTPGVAEGLLEDDINASVLKLLSDKKFLPPSKDGISAEASDEVISFGFPISFQKKASERFRGCIVQWFEGLQSTEALNFGAYVYATLESPENEWKAYGSKMADEFIRATGNGSTDCAEKKPSRDDTEGLLIQIDSYLAKSSAQPKDIKARLTWFGDKVVAAMLADVTQKRTSDLLAYVRQWLENIRVVALEPTRTLDFQELWSGKKLSRAELAGRALFRLLPKEKIDAAAASKDVGVIYGALFSVDSFITACSTSEGATSPSLCIDNSKIFWLDLKTANGNAQFILTK